MVNVLGLVTKATLFQKRLLISKNKRPSNDSRFYDLFTTLISCYMLSGLNAGIPETDILRQIKTAAINLSI